MKNLLLLWITLGIFSFSSAQDLDPRLPDKNWYLTQLVIDGVVYNSSDYGAQPSIQFFQEISGDYSFSTSNSVSIACLFPMVAFFEDLTYNFTLPSDPTACLAEQPCSNPDPTSLCSQIHDLHYVYYSSSATLPVSYFITENGDGTLSMTTNNSNGDEAFYNDFLLSSNDFLKDTVRIYPNPTNDQLYVDSKEIIGTQMSIYSLSGKTLFTSNTIEDSIDVSSFPAGMYFLEVVSEKARTIQKFIKQ